MGFQKKVHCNELPLQPRLPNRIFWIFFVLACAFAMARYVPPFQSPDENVHLLRAAMIARGQWLLQRVDTPARDSGMVDQNFALFSDALANMPTQTTAKVEPPAQTRVNVAGHHGWANHEVMVKAAGTGYYAPLIYLPHSAGLWLGEHGQLNMLHSYELARVIVIVTALLIAFYAWHLVQPNVLMLMLVLTPMALFQWVSPTIDGLCNALLLLFIALWAKIFKDIKQPPQVAHELLLYCCTFFLCTAKTNLLPILIVPVFLLIRKFSWRRLLAQGILLSSVLGWVAFAVSSSSDIRLTRKHTNVEILRAYLADPLEFFEVIGRSIEAGLDFYVHSFLGKLGWLNAPISNSSVRNLAAFLLVGLIFILIAHRTLRFSATHAIALFVAITSFFLTFAALAITYNDFPTPVIIGVQGRYFIAPLMILAFALGPINTDYKPYRWHEVLLLTLYIPYSIYVTTRTVARNYSMDAFAF